MWLGLVVRISDQERRMRAWEAMVCCGGWSDDEASDYAPYSSENDSEDFSEEDGEDSDSNYTENSDVE